MGWHGLAKGLEEQKRTWARKVSSVLLGREKPLRKRRGHLATAKFRSGLVGEFIRES